MFVTSHEVNSFFGNCNGARNFKFMYPSGVKINTMALVEYYNFTGISPLPVVKLAGLDVQRMFMHLLLEETMKKYPINEVLSLLKNWRVRKSVEERAQLWANMTNRAIGVKSSFPKKWSIFMSARELVAANPDTDLCAWYLRRDKSEIEQQILALGEVI